MGPIVLYKCRFCEVEDIRAGQVVHLRDLWSPTHLISTSVDFLMFLTEEQQAKQIEHLKEAGVIDMAKSLRKYQKREAEDKDEKEMALLKIRLRYFERLQHFGIDWSTVSGILRARPFQGEWYPCKTHIHFVNLLVDGKKLLQELPEPIPYWEPDSPVAGFDKRVTALVD